MSPLSVAALAWCLAVAWLVTFVWWDVVAGGWVGAGAATASGPRWMVTWSCHAASGAFHPLFVLALRELAYSVYHRVHRTVSASRVPPTEHGVELCGYNSRRGVCQLHGSHLPCTQRGVVS